MLLYIIQKRGLRKHLEYMSLDTRYDPHDISSLYCLIDFLRGKIKNIERSMKYHCNYFMSEIGSFFTLIRIGYPADQSGRKIYSIHHSKMIELSKEIYSVFLRFRHYISQIYIERISLLLYVLQGFDFLRSVEQSRLSIVFDQNRMKRNSVDSGRVEFFLERDRDGKAGFCFGTKLLIKDKISE